MLATRTAALSYISIIDNGRIRLIYIVQKFNLYCCAKSYNLTITTERCSMLGNWIFEGVQAIGL